MAETDVGDELAALRIEVEQLRALVGPSEESYRKLQLDVLGARDAAMAAEAEIGAERARNQVLQTEVVRLQRDFAWMRERVVGTAKTLRDRTLAIGRLTSR